MKKFIKLRYKLSDIGRENPILVYADSVNDALQKVRERLDSEYPKGYQLLPHRVEVFTDAQEADLNCGSSRGLFDALSPDDMEQFLLDRAKASPPPAKQKRSKKNTFDRECDRRIQQLQSAPR